MRPVLLRRSLLFFIYNYFFKIILRGGLPETPEAILAGGRNDLEG